MRVLVGLRTIRSRSWTMNSIALCRGKPHAHSHVCACSLLILDSHTPCHAMPCHSIPDQPTLSQSSALLSDDVCLILPASESSSRMASTFCDEACIVPTTTTTTRRRNSRQLEMHRVGAKISTLARRVHPSPISTAVIDPCHPRRRYQITRLCIYI